MATLAELRARKVRKLPTRVRRISLDLDLLADIQRLEEEKRTLLIEAARVPDSEERDNTQPVRKMAEGADPRIAEIETEVAELYDRLRESEGELLLRGITGGEWQAWKDEHQPREDNVTDAQVGFGLVNATDLLADLGRYVVSWNGEDFSDGDWDGWFRDSVSAGDLRDLVQDVIAMHEISGVRAPKSSTTSSTTVDGSNGSGSPAG